MYTKCSCYEIPFYSTAVLSLFSLPSVESGCWERKKKHCSLWQGVKFLHRKWILDLFVSMGLNFKTILEGVLMQLVSWYTLVQSGGIQDFFEGICYLKSLIIKFSKQTKKFDYHYQYIFVSKCKLFGYIFCQRLSWFGT